MENVEDKIADRIQQTLSTTQWKVASLQRISGGNANFTYRAVPEAGSPTMFIKHSENFAALNSDFSLDVTRSDYEWFMLSTLSDHEPATTQRFEVRSPKVLGAVGNTKIIEDLPGSTTLKAYLSKYGSQLDAGIAYEIGVGLGKWLTQFHNWIDADTTESEIVRDRICTNPMIPLREGLYMGSYPASMEKFADEISWPSREKYEAIETAVLNMYHTRTGGIHGDFWTGNMVLEDELFAEDEHLHSEEGYTRSERRKIFVVDFEVSQLGSRAQDFAQCLAELWMVHHFHGSDTPLQVMRGFVDGYGVSKNVELALQIAMHFGIHIVVIPWRYNTGWKQGEPLIECLRFGNECLVRGFEGDVEWFQKGSLAFLFPSR